MMGTILQDLRSGLRTFVRRPGFAFLATGTLALGIGAYAALFSVVDRVLLRPVDLPAPDELVVARMQVDGELRSLTGPNAMDLIRESDSFASAAAFWNTSLTIESPDGTRERRPAVGATPGVFEALGLPLQLGRPWGPEVVGTGSVAAVVMSDRLWRSRFGADPDIVGRTVLVSGTPVEITGVMAPGLEFPTAPDVDVVIPPPTDPGRAQRAGLGGFTLLGRLRPGVTVEQARQEVEATWEGIRSQHPGDLLDHGIAVMGVQDYLVRDVRPALLTLLGATSLLLILACANVANLMLARGIGRSTEMSVRASLGAGRRRLARQLLVESGVLAGVAGVAGTLAAGALLWAVRSLAPPEIPGISEVGLSVTGVLFALVVAIGCALLVGMVPAARAWGADLAGALRGGARSTGGRRLRGFRGGLVVAQVAASVVLVIGAGLLGRSFSNLSDVDPGYRTDGRLTATLAVPLGVLPDRAARAEFIRRAERAVAVLPGVRSVGTTLRPPFASGELSVPVRLAEADGMTLESAPRAEIGIVSAGYLETLEIPLLRGRRFTDEDRGDSPRVAIVSESLARSLFGDANPIGRRLSPVIGDWDDATNWAEVVGVVGDIRLEGLDAQVRGTLYVPMPQLAQPGGTLVVATHGDPGALAEPVRDALLSAEPELLVPTIRTLASLRADSLARPRFHSLLLGVFSFLALTLSAVGVYGLLSYSVATRRTELNLRMALGADRRSVVGLVVGGGMKLVFLGLLIGLGCALLASRSVSELLFGVSPTDPAAYGGALAGVAALALVGCLLPALRAGSGDGLDALRGE